MKVLIIVPGFPINVEDIKGGVYSALSNLLIGFANANIAVRVVSFNREISEPLVTNYSHNIAIHYTPEGKLPYVFNFIFKGSAVIKNTPRNLTPL